MQSYRDKQTQLITEIEIGFKKGSTPSTLVPPVEDYAADNRICLTTVVFPSQDIIDKIYQTISLPLQKADSTPYYYPKESYHLTIQAVRKIAFPPNFTQQDCDKVKEALHTFMEQIKPLRIELANLFELPSSVALCGLGDERYGDLIKSLQKLLEEIGIPSDQKQASDEIFFSNLTVCRFHKTPSNNFYKEITRLKNINIGEINLNKISLITTNAVCHPSKTSVIAEYSLTK